MRNTFGTMVYIRQRGGGGSASICKAPCLAAETGLMCFRTAASAARLGLSLLQVAQVKSKFYIHRNITHTSEGAIVTVKVRSGRFRETGMSERHWFFSRQNYNDLKQNQNMGNQAFRVCT